MNRRFLSREVKDFVKDFSILLMFFHAPLALILFLEGVNRGTQVGASVAMCLGITSVAYLVWKFLPNDADEVRRSDLKSELAHRR